MGVESQIEQAQTLMAIAFGYRLARCLHVVVELGVPDAIGESPAPITELATDSVPTPSHCKEP